MPSDLWLPPGAIPFDDDVERVIAESDDPAEARRLAEELRDAGVLADVYLRSAVGQIERARSSPAKLERDHGRRAAS